MDKIWVYYLAGFCSVLIADISQIMLKKAALKQYASWLRSYLNFQVIFAYCLFVLSTVCSVFSLRKLPLSMTPIWQSMGQILVAIMSFFFLHEKITRQKVIGIGIIIAGIFVFAL